MSCIRDLGGGGIKLDFWFGENGFVIIDRKSWSFLLSFRCGDLVLWS